MIEVMLIIGHRGAPREAPENTLESFRAALEAGADIIELDIRLTRDAIPIAIHDQTLLRTHGKHLSIAKHTYAELVERKLTPHLATLDEILEEFFGVILLNIELKAPGSGDIVIQTLQRHVRRASDWNNVLISSFRARELIKTRQRAPTVPLALLHNHNPFLFIAYERRLHFSAVGFHRLYTNPLATMVARKIGLFCYAYTVDRPHAALLLAQQGIDGIATNDPGRLLSETARHT